MKCRNEQEKTTIRRPRALLYCVALTLTLACAGCASLSGQRVKSTEPVTGIPYYLSQPTFSLTVRNAESSKGGAPATELGFSAKADPDQQYAASLRSGWFSNTELAFSLAPDGRLLGMNTKVTDPLPSILKPLGDFAAGALSIKAAAAASGEDPHDFIKAFRDACEDELHIQPTLLKHLETLSNKSTKLDPASISLGELEAIESVAKECLQDLLAQKLETKEDCVKTADLAEIAKAYRGLELLREIAEAKPVKASEAVAKTFSQRRDAVFAALRESLDAKHTTPSAKLDAAITEYRAALRLLLHAAAALAVPAHARSRETLEEFLGRPLPALAAAKSHAETYAIFRGELEKVDQAVTRILSAADTSSKGAEARTIAGQDVPALRIKKERLGDEELLPAFVRAWWQYGVSDLQKSAGVPGGVVYMEGVLQ